MRALCWFVLAGAAWAQVDPDTITVTSRNSQAQPGPETVSYSVTVTAAMEKGLDDVLQAVVGAGVTERDLTNVSWPSVKSCTPGRGGCGPALAWSFRFSSPDGRVSRRKNYGAFGSAGRTGGRVRLSERLPVRNSIDFDGHCL